MQIVRKLREDFNFITQSYFKIPFPSCSQSKYEAIVMIYFCKEEHGKDKAKQVNVVPWEQLGLGE